jgi:hypothetical protein
MLNDIARVHPRILPWTGQVLQGGGEHKLLKQQLLHAWRVVATSADASNIE